MARDSRVDLRVDLDTYNGLATAAKEAQRTLSDYVRLELQAIVKRNKLAEKTKARRTNRAAGIAGA